MGVFTRPAIQTSDGQAGMSKKTGRSDCEYWLQLRKCGCTKQLTFICGGAQKALRESAESAKKGHGKAL